jgi:hypothetical protein
MPPRKKSSAVGASSVIDNTAPPEVIVDFRFDQGLLYIALINLSDAPAYRVSVKFAKPLRGLGRDCAVSSLPMFRRVEFLAPHKRIETLLDSSYAFFKRREPTVIKALVTFRNSRGKPHRHEIVHDLKIYKDISYVVNREPAVSPATSQNLAAADAAPVIRPEDPTYGRSKRQSLLQFQLPR